MKKHSKNNLSNTIKPFFDLNFFFLIITIILFGLLILTTASIDFASKNYNKEVFNILDTKKKILDTIKSRCILYKVFLNNFESNKILDHLIPNLNLNNDASLYL